NEGADRTEFPSRGFPSPAPIEHNRQDGDRQATLPCRTLSFCEVKLRMLRASRRAGSASGLLFAAALLQLSFAAPAVAGECRFQVRLAGAVQQGPFTGGGYIFFNDAREPRHDPGWFAPGQFVARDVQNWKPDEPVTFASGDRAVLAYPRPLAELDLAGKRAQA